MSGHVRAIALIEVGTNSCKFLIARVHGRCWELVDFHRRTTRIGARPGRAGRLASSRVTETARAVREFARSVPRDVPRFAFATHALRRAPNRVQVLDTLSAAAGCRLRVLSGRAEARFAYLSARRLPNRGTRGCVVVDVGGGSTEVIVGRGDDVLSARSLPLGALHLTERFLHAERMDAGQLHALQHHINGRVERALSGMIPAAWHRTAATLIGSGGSSTSVARMTAALRDRRLRSVWPLPTDLLRVRSGEIRRLLERCPGSTTAGRRRWSGLDADRADIIPAGLAIMRAFTIALGKRIVLINPGGVREGVLTHLLRNDLRW